jgi:AcrR family transcriptional regulator
MSTALQEATSAGRRRGRPRALTHERIAAAALEIVDRDGLDALSMPALSRALGVGTMTLYVYFRTKDELLDAVLDAAVETPRLRPTGAWRDDLAAVVRLAHDTLSRHPALVQVRFRRPVLRPQALRFGEAVVGILVHAGFEPAEATSAFRLLFTYVFGFAGLSPQRGAEEARRDAAAAVAALPPEQYPNLTANAADFSHAMAGGELFDFGLERILDGLEAALDRTKPPTPS